MQLILCYVYISLRHTKFRPRRRGRERTKARKTEETVLPIKYVKLGDFAPESIITNSSCVWQLCGGMHLNQIDHKLFPGFVIHRAFW